MIELYGYTSCSSCRKTDEMLKSSGAEYVYRDYFRQRFSHVELVGLLTRAGLTPREILSTRSKVYQTRAAEIDSLDDDALLMLMLEEPTLIRRPVVMGSGDVVIGHSPAKLTALIEQAN